jgi:hypothetical protein
MIPAHGITALEVIITSLTSLVILLLGIQINQTMSLRKAMNGIKDDFNTHVLQMTKLMAEKVSLDSCSGIRQECLALNKTIIMAPLEKQLASLKCKCTEKRKENQHDKETLWAALRTHSHTHIDGYETDKVILNK